jgi:hypothetical protein
MLGWLRESWVNVYREQTIFTLNKKSQEIVSGAKIDCFFNVKSELTTVTGKNAAFVIDASLHLTRVYCCTISIKRTLDMYTIWVKNTTFVDVYSPNAVDTSVCPRHINSLKQITEINLNLMFLIYFSSFLSNTVMKTLTFQFSFMNDAKSFLCHFIFGTIRKKTKSK